MSNQEAVTLKILRVRMQENYHVSAHSPLMSDDCTVGASTKREPWIRACVEYFRYL
jgi:hypothetical protein